MLKLLAIHVVDLALHVSAVVAGHVALYQIYMMVIVGGYARPGGCIVIVSQPGGPNSRFESVQPCRQHGPAERN